MKWAMKYVTTKCKNRTITMKLKNYCKIKLDEFERKFELKQLKWVICEMHTQFN